MEISGERFAALFSTMAEGVVFRDAAGRVVAHNESAERILGLPAGELTGVGTFDATLRPIQEDGSPFPGDAHPAIVALRTGESQCGVVMGIHRKDGTLAWISLQSHPVRRDGVIDGVVTILADITGRKAAEDALRISEERWKLAVECSRDGIWDHNIATGHVFYSGRWKEILGYDEDELSANISEWRTRIHPDDLPVVIAAVQNHWAAKTPFYQSEYRVRCKDGSWKWILARGSVVSHAADGTVQRFVGTIADVSERKYSEERLRGSEERLVKVFRCSPAAIVLADREGGRILEVNDAFERITGYSRDEVVGLPDMEARFFEDTAELAKATALLDRDGRFSDIEFRLRRKDGELRVCVISGELVHVHGHAFSISATVDITERRRAEEGLRRSEARYRAVVENSLEGILFASAEGVILERSPSYRLLSGYSNEERIGYVGFDSVHPDDLPRVRQTWAAVLNEPEQFHRLEFRIRHKDESWCWIETSAQNLLNNPNVEAIVMTSRDITDRIRTQEALEQARSNLTALLESTDDVIWSVDTQHRVLTFNQAFARTILANYGVELRVGEVLYHRLGGRAADEWPEFYNRALREGACRVEYVTAAGRTMEFSLNALLSCGERVGVSVFGKDITTRKQDEAERERLWAQLAQSQKMESIGRLAGGVAHDFNNLLTVINGYSQLAVARLKTGDPLRNQISEIRKAGERAAGLTRQLLAFSRKQVMQPRALNLNRIVGDMQSMLRRLVGEDVEVVFTLCAESPIVHADPHQLEQVIMNLAVNGRDAMRSGGRLKIETALVTGAEASELRPGRHAMLAVSDTGIGMDEATLQRIYEPFFTTKEAGQGTGLGLSMVQGIVEQSGGHIHVASEPGEGSTFRVYLPALNGAVVETETPTAVSALQGTETILVVEDQPEVCDYATAVLQEYGYRVIQASNAADALAICDREPDHIHLLLTDVVMPQTSGRDLAARLAVTRPKTKALFMSGYTDDVIAQHGVLDEGTHFLQKPFSPDELAEKVREVLGPPPSAIRVLVVDDEEGVRRYLRMVLEEAGYIVNEAADGKEALDLALEDPPEVVITDLVMPEQEGIETIRALRRRVPQLAIVAISGAFGGQFLNTAKILGADAILDKPLRAEVLLAKVSDLLARRSSRNS
jgi:two-component system cell cycle sensor histidine kinase/response regulator CckA